MLQNNKPFGQGSLINANSRCNSRMFPQCFVKQGCDEIRRAYHIMNQSLKTCMSEKVNHTDNTENGMVTYFFSISAGDETQQVMKPVAPKWDRKVLGIGS